MAKERLYLFDTTLRLPSDRSREASEDGQTESPPRDESPNDER